MDHPESTPEREGAQLPDYSGRVIFESGPLYMAAQQGAYRAMPTEERAELERWERRNLDGHNVGTSDWPGWEKYIGLPPWKAKEKEREWPS